MFERYAAKWCEAHKDEYDADSLEGFIPKLYRHWCDRPTKLLGGVSPREYLGGFDTAALIEMLRADVDAAGVLVDTLTEREDAPEKIAAILKGGKLETGFTMILMNVLEEMKGDHPLDVYVSFIMDKTLESGLRELAAEILAANAAESAPLLFGFIESADLEQRTLIAEVLSSAPKDERTFTLLCELFLTGENVPLYAGYLGKYGDERAASMLYASLDDCDYFEFIEIKNAIERMGGTVDENYRDFSDDETYRLIKGIR